jgi:hypothetical protein
MLAPSSISWTTLDACQNTTAPITTFQTIITVADK